MIREMAERLLFPREAVKVLCEREEKMRAYDNEIDRAMNSLYTPGNMQFIDILEKISLESGIDRRESDMVFLLLAAIPLVEKYRLAGYDDTFFDQTMADLRIKLYECYNTFGIWGTFVTAWFKGFYLLERFRLGRMQYERMEFPLEDYRGIVKKGDIVLNCHIPSDGAMLIEDIKQSIRMAYKFYASDRRDGRIVFICFSWLLYSPIFKDFKKGSNIRNFYELFDIVENREQENNPDFWRVFNVNYSPDALQKVTVDNSLRRAVYDHIKNGGRMGYGVGMIIVDEDF